MNLNDKRIVECRPGSDVTQLVIGRDVDVTGSVSVVLAVFDADSEDTSPALPLATAALSASQAIKAARALLVAAGVDVGRANICGWNTF